MFACKTPKHVAEIRQYCRDINEKNLNSMQIAFYNIFSTLESVLSDSSIFRSSKTKKLYDSLILEASKNFPQEIDQYKNLQKHAMSFSEFRPK